MADVQPSKPIFGSRAWRKGLLRNDTVLKLSSALVYHVMRFIHFSHGKANQPADQWHLIESHTPAIFAMWHGQHLMLPFVWPKQQPLDAMISKSADAEINARILQRMGIGTIRGSGGRDQKQKLDRGGAKALLALRRSLAEHRNVAIIADISHKQRRQAGEGVVTLAKISGRPIIPIAYATSNFYTVDKSWDKTTINLPFGKRGFAMGNPIYIDADDDLSQRQFEITRALDEVTHRAAVNAGIKVVSNQ